MLNRFGEIEREAAKKKHSLSLSHWVNADNVKLLKLACRSQPVDISQREIVVISLADQRVFARVRIDRQQSTRRKLANRYSVR